MDRTSNSSNVWRGHETAHTDGNGDACGGTTGSGKPYVQKVLPQFMLGQVWLVDRNGAVRLQRSQNMFNGIEKAFEEEVMYRARQLMN